MLTLSRIGMVSTVVLAAFSTAEVQNFPWWEQALQHNSGTTDATPVPSMKMGPHMQMSQKASMHAGDEARGDQIVDSARRVIDRYVDVNTALRDGYKPFFPSGKIGEEVHYTNYRYAKSEREKVDYDRPGSILYKRTPSGMKAVGVMYTAPREATAEELDAVAPLSLATWHRHIDFCGWPSNAPISARYGRDAQFGPQGSIHTEQACNEAHGLWIPVVFGWMTHVYPNAEPEHIWGGMDMAMDGH
jgi:hypothetical protein